MKINMIALDFLTLIPLLKNCSRVPEFCRQQHERTQIWICTNGENIRYL